MDVTIKKARLWVNEHKKKDGGTWTEYSIGVSKKNLDGSYINTSMKVRFGKDVNVPENLPNGYDLEEFSGFFSVDVYPDRNGVEVRKPMIIITEVPQWDDLDSFAQAEEDVPF